MIAAIIKKFIPIPTVDPKLLIHDSLKESIDWFEQTVPRGPGVKVDLSKIQHFDPNNVKINME